MDISIFCLPLMTYQLGLKCTQVQNTCQYELEIGYECCWCLNAKATSDTSEENLTPVNQPHTNEKE